MVMGCRESRGAGALARCTIGLVFVDMCPSLALAAVGNHGEQALSERERDEVPC